MLRLQLVIELRMNGLKMRLKLLKTDQIGPIGIKETPSSKGVKFFARLAQAYCNLIGPAMNNAALCNMWETCSEKAHIGATCGKHV
jgi:hypothetical protein